MFNKRLEKWRKERGLDITQGFKFDLNTQVSFVFEEIGVEFLRAKTEDEKIDALCDVIVFAFNGANLLGHTPNYLEGYTADYRDILDSALDLLIVRDKTICKHIYSLIYTVAKNRIENMGYDFEKCMDETLKEIESRTGEVNPNTGKWEKYKTDEAKAKWYKANYSRCKRGIHISNMLDDEAYHNEKDYFKCNNIK